MENLKNSTAHARHPQNDDRRLIPASVTRDLCGGVSDMALWRWGRNKSLGFPEPVYIGTRRYWREAEILAWLETRTRQKPPAPCRPTATAA